MISPSWGIGDSLFNWTLHNIILPLLVLLLPGSWSAIGIFLYSLWALYKKEKKVFFSKLVIFLHTSLMMEPCLTFNFHNFIVLTYNCIVLTHNFIVRSHRQTCECTHIHQIRETIFLVHRYWFFFFFET